VRGPRPTNPTGLPRRNDQASSQMPLLKGVANPWQAADPSSRPRREGDTIGPWRPIR
jgi:hypothetical protein